MAHRRSHPCCAHPVGLGGENLGAKMQRGSSASMFRTATNDSAKTAVPPLIAHTIAGVADDNNLDDGDVANDRYEDDETLIIAKMTTNIYIKRMVTEKVKS
jgi:hypothetical protein